MSNINELNQKIAFLNAECQRVNNERAVNIGKHDTLSKQLESAIKSYNEKYGKNITVDSLEQEIKAVMSAKEKEIANLEAVLNAIKSGDYNTANNLVNGVVIETKVEEPSVEAPVQVEVPKVEAPVVETPVSPATSPIATPAFVAPSNPEPVAPPVVPPVVEPVVPPVVEPIAPPVVEPVAPPVMTPPPVMSAPPQMTPPPVAAPNGAPKSFAAILGGTAFEQ